jgi:hypothetical protein
VKGAGICGGLQLGLDLGTVAGEGETRRVDVAIRKVYILNVEETGDIVFTPAGIVILLENGSFTVYCPKSSHNRYRAAVSRHSWESLESGVEFKGAHFRLEDVSSVLQDRGWTHASSIPDILHFLFETKRKYLFFLSAYL